MHSSNFTLSLALCASMALGQYRGYQEKTNDNPHRFDPYYHDEDVLHGLQHSHEHKANHYLPVTGVESNPWGQNTIQSQVADRSGWWSPYQEFRPPIIPYEPAPLKEPTYAVCEDLRFTNFSGEITFAQVPWHPIQMQASFTDSTTDGSISQKIFLRINETGLLGNSCDTADDDSEFNPLFAVDRWGNPYSYQDPQRGRIDTIDEFTSSLEYYQELEQNLGGKDSIIGRSITLYTADTFDGAQTLRTCCTIVRQNAPEQEHLRTTVHENPYPFPQHPNPQHQHEVQVHTHIPAPRNHVIQTHSVSAEKPDPSFRQPIVRRPPYYGLSHGSHYQRPQQHQPIRHPVAPLQQVYQPRW